MVSIDHNYDLEKMNKMLESLVAKVEQMEIKMDPKPQWLDRKSVARILNISLRTVDGYLASGLLNYSKVQGRVFILYEDVIKMLENGKNVM